LAGGLRPAPTLYRGNRDFVIDLDDIWKWLGFSQKAMAKRALEKNFKQEKDYKILLLLPNLRSRQ
jgi:hypothetical protein